MRTGAGASSSAVAVRLDALEADTRPQNARAVPMDAMLGRVCRVVRDALGVSRATVLHLGEPGSLEPVVSIAREDHDDLWQRFRTMRPISLELTPSAAAALRGEEVVVVTDAASSVLVPAEWQQAFGLTSLAIAPLHVDRRPWGVLVVDDGERRHEFGARDVRALAELAGLASAAIAATVRAASADAETALRAALRDAVSRVVTSGDLADAIYAVSQPLADATGYELLGAALHDRRLAAVLNVDRASGYDADALKQLRHGAGEAIASGGRLLVPLRGWDAPVGVLVLRGHGDAVKRLDLVHEVAERIAAVVAQAGAAERENAAAVDAAHAAARLDLAKRAIDRTLRLLAGPGYAARRSAPTLLSVSSVNHTRLAVDQLDDVRQVLDAQGGSPSFATSLRALLEPGQADTYEMHWTTSGTPRLVDSGCEIACLRSAARFLALALESRARILGARVSFTQDGVECLLSSNGRLRDPGAVSRDGAVDLLGPWVIDIGGSVEIESGDAAFSARLVLPYVQGDRAIHDRRPAPARARAR